MSSSDLQVTELLLKQILRVVVIVSDAAVCPCLWVGTSLGSVLVVAFGMPTDGARNTEPISVMPSGTLDTSQLMVQ